MSNSPLLPLLVAVFSSIFEVSLLCVAGYILATRGILDRKTRRQLNRLNVNFFTPSLIFSKVAFFLSPEILRELWIIPLFFVLLTLMSMTVSNILGRLLRLRTSQRSFAMAAAMFMNTNSLPIALIQSLVVTVPDLKWEKHDNKDAMLGRALNYLMLFNTFGMALRWSYGVRLLARADSAQVPVTAGVDVESDPNERSPLLPGRSSSSSTSGPHSHHERSISSTLQVLPSSSRSSSSSSLSIAQIHLDPAHLTLLSNSPPRPAQTPAPMYHSFPNTPNASNSNLPSYSSTNSASTAAAPAEAPARPLPSHDAAYTEEPVPLSPPPEQSPMSAMFAHARGALERLSEFMTPPVWAALAALVVACAPPVQHALEVHAQSIKGALSAAGSCAIPMKLIVLGAYFHRPPIALGEGAAPLPGSTWRDNERVGTGATAWSLKTLTRMFNNYKLKRLDLPVKHGEDWTGDGIGHGLAVGTGDSHDDSNGGPTKPPISTGMNAEHLHPGETKTVFIAIASRMVITPVVLLPLMALSKRWDLQAVLDDPVFVVSNVLLVSSPPALALAQTTGAAPGDALERLISRTIFWAYCVVTPPAAIVYVLIGLLMTKL